MVLIKRSSQFNEAQLWQKIIDDFKKVDDEVRAAELEIDAQFEAEKSQVRDRFCCI